MTKMTNQEKAVAALITAGFEPAGMTPTERVVFLVNDGGPGPGKRGATLGGRARFVKPGTTLRATVGKITTCFYDVVNGNTVYRANLPTKETEKVAEFAAKA